MKLSEYNRRVEAKAREELERIKKEMPWMVEQLALAQLRNQVVQSCEAQHG